MNLELIKKYEKEFLHMLHGGKVLMGKKDLVTNTIKWYPSVLNPFVETSESIIIVIDDIYCTYRIALVEGKTVEVYVRHGVKALDKQPWRRFAIGCSTFDLPVECYRIKPEEPKFKIGDWITVNGPAGTFIECVSGINDDTYVLSGTNICYKSQASKWNPTQGEVCIVWDNDDICSAAIVRCDYIDTAGQYTSTDNSWWDNCIPFTGTLPPHMRESK